MFWTTYYTVERQVTSSNRSGVREREENEQAAQK